MHTDMSKKPSSSNYAFCNTKNLPLFTTKPLGTTGSLSPTLNEGIQKKEDFLVPSPKRKNRPRPDGSKPRAREGDSVD